MQLYQQTTIRIKQRKMSNLVNPIYHSFSTAQQQLSELTPIDYFFAKEVVVSVTEHFQPENNATTNKQSLLFHLSVALNQSLQDGHSCLPVGQIAGQWLGKASDNDGVITHQGFVFPNETEIKQLLAELNVNPENNQLVVYFQGKLYLRRYFLFEQELSQKILQANSLQQSVETEAIAEIVDRVFPDNQYEIDETSGNEIDWQKVAVANAINKGFSIIAGGPGTGKTYTVTKLLAALVMLAKSTESNLMLPNIALVAPTGKAAQRLSESIANAITQFRGQLEDKILDAIPVEAQTIHRLLGVIPHDPNFRHHQDNLLPYDIILIDEVSMVDLAMMTRVFRAIRKQTKVILLGDADQLPSVAAGSVLADLAIRPHQGYSADNIRYLQQVTGFNGFNKGKKQYADHLTFLVKSRRFDGEGAIGKMAGWVIAGDEQSSWHYLVQHQQSLSRMVIKEQPLLLLPNQNYQWLDNFLEYYIVPMFACQQLEQLSRQFSLFRVLCATRKGGFGIDYINQYIEEYLSKKGLISKLSNQQHALYHGKPIMIAENDYSLGLYNGDIGFIWRNDNGQLMAMFEQQKSSFSAILPSRLPKFESVYAMTIHKTQGSEFEHVAMVLPANGDNRLLSRELLYTGITRAKERLAIATSESVWYQAVDIKVKRHSSLFI